MAEESNDEDTMETRSNEEIHESTGNVPRQSQNPQEGISYSKPCGYVPHPRLTYDYVPIPLADGSTKIDVTKAVSDSIMKNPLWSQRVQMSPNSCIIRVLGILRRHNERAYKPATFSIGPLHHSNINDDHKFHYLNDLVSRVGIQVERLVESVAELEPVARAHYANKLNLSPAELVEMLVLDGCFIIEYLRKFGIPSMEGDIGDPLFGMSCAYQTVIHDLMLLENQIPWVVLGRLFTLTRDEKLNPQYSLPRLVLKFYQFVLPINCTDFEEIARHLESPTTKYRHILELLREVLIRGAPSLPLKETLFAEVENWEVLPPIPTATELENAGITLSNNKSNSLSISFNRGVLEVSPLRIEDTSEALFRNIIAFEQCVPGCTSAFTSYAILLDNLINTTGDLDRLQQKGIISFMLNPDDALGFFNKLYNDTALNEFYYPNVCADINAYCRRRRWPRWRASLVRNYFSSPWVIVSTLAAFVLLVLTFLQTLYTMKS